MKFGYLKKVDISEIWRKEEDYFLGWISRSKNLELLSKEVGFPVTPLFEKSETSAPQGTCLAGSGDGGIKILIEAGITELDDARLGVLLVHAARTQADRVIWIVNKPSDRHYRALEWMNARTAGQFKILMVQIEVWQIEDSSLAPKFRLVSDSRLHEGANDGAGLFRTGADRGEIESGEFWDYFREYTYEKAPGLQLATLPPQQWDDIGRRSSRSHICLTLNSKKGTIGCEVYIPNTNQTYFRFLKHKDAIERDVGEKLEWIELPSRRASKIKLTRRAELNQDAKWEEYFDWFSSKVETIQTVLKKYGSLP